VSGSTPLAKTTIVPDLVPVVVGKNLTLIAQVSPASSTLHVVVTE
jgi:hypothetical protein